MEWSLSLARVDDGAWKATLTGPRGQALATLIAHRTMVQWAREAARQTHDWLHRQAARHRGRNDGGAVSGSFLGTLRRIGKKMARAKLINRVMKTARTVLRDPRIAQAVGLAQFVPVVGQAIGAGYVAARAADSLIQRARRGDPQALRSLDQVRQQAAAGAPAARTALRTLEAASAANREQQRAIPQQRAAASGMISR